MNTNLLYTAIFVTHLCGLAVKLEWMLNVPRTTLQGHGSIVKGKHSDELHSLSYGYLSLKALYSLTLLVCVSQTDRESYSMWQHTTSYVDKWHAGLVRRGSFNSLESHLPTSPILQIVSAPPSLLGTQHLMHRYTAINTFSIDHARTSIVMWLLFYLHLLSWAFKVPLMSIGLRNRESRVLLFVTFRDRQTALLSHVFGY